ncbi:MAG TPA: hypothetical protein VK181_02640 [Rhizobium sp.]|nr:hypothetical protein [Rhizobium sp.]
MATDFNALEADFDAFVAAFTGAVDSRIGLASIDDLADVQIVSPANNEVLTYETATGLWKNKPAAGGGGSPGGASGEIQYNNAGAFAGAADVEIEGGQLRLPAIANPASPAAGGVKVFASSEKAGGAWPSFELPDGTVFDWPLDFITEQVSAMIPNYGSNSASLIGCVITAAGTATARNLADTDIFTRTPGMEYRITTAATTAVAGVRFNAGRFQVGGLAANRGGLRAFFKGSASTGANTATHRFFMGFWGNSGATDVNPSTLTNMFGIGYDSADTNLQFMHNDGTGTATKIDLGASFPKPTLASSSLWQLEVYSPPGTTREIQYRVTNLFNGAVATGTITTDLPGAGVYMQPHIYASVGGTSSVIGININKIAAVELGKG